MKSLDNVCAQEGAMRFLTKTVQTKQIAHAYLFFGGEGLGKKGLAKMFAQSLNCVHETIFSECYCDQCRKIEMNIHPDVKWVGLDESERSIKLEKIHELHEWMSLRALEGKKKVIIVNKAERFTEEAANAFLKALEEPPADTHIILLAHQAGRLLDTIRSRVVEVRFVPLDRRKVYEILQSECSRDEAHYLASQSKGSIGLARAYKEDGFFEFKNGVIDKLLYDGISLYFFGLMGTGQTDLDKIFSVLESFFHDVILMRVGVDASYVVNQDRIADARSLVEKYSLKKIVGLIELLEDARLSLKKNVNAKLILSKLAVSMNE